MTKLDDVLHQLLIDSILNAMDAIKLVDDVLKGMDPDDVRAAIATAMSQLVDAPPVTH